VEDSMSFLGKFSLILFEIDKTRRKIVGSFGGLGGFENL
jgi:hypothetical protein